MRVQSQRISCRPVTTVVSGLLFYMCHPSCSQPLPAFSINALLPGYSYTGPTALDGTNMCKCNTVAYNLLSACDACQSAIWISCGRLLLRPSVHWLIRDSAGPNIRATAQQPWLPRRESSWAIRWGLGHELTDFFTRRFPNAVPSGTRVPHWALMDPTVRSPLAPCQKSANKTLLLCSRSSRASGMPPPLSVSVVSN
jgi:hypothetical protein